MQRSDLLKFWNDAWTEGLWAAAWSKSIDGLSPQQAAWKPAAGRHSIWQIVHHMLFWREDALARLTGKGAPSEDDVARLNFLEPADLTDAAWNATRDRLRRSQEAVAAALADPSKSIERLQYLLPHDSYHIGQINLLRALQGLKPIE
jgi:hypothetical protein